MSFGFSVGDIILVSQSAYELYSTVTTGRRAAGKDLKELEDVLFGLHCALDHLGKTAEDISATALNKQDANAIEMRQKLNTMVDSCRATLTELDSVTKPYREAADPGGNSIIDGTTDLLDDGTPTNPNKKLSLARFKKSFRANWTKIRWDIERNSLNEYREKLQAHTDAINIVLSTFLWSATNRIEADGKFNAEKMQDLQNQALQSNTSLLQLVQEIHNMLLDSKRASFSPPVPPARPSPHQKGVIRTRGLPLSGVGDGGLHGGTIPSINAHFSSFALVAPTTFPHAANKISTPFRPLAMQSGLLPNEWIAIQRPASNRKPEGLKRARELPAAIVLLNEKRQLSGSKEFKGYHEKYHPSKPLSKPSFLALETPTVHQLHDGLIYIFQPFPPTATSQATVNREEQKKEIIRWTQGLDHLLDSWISQPVLSTSNSKETEQANRNEMIDLLIGMNGLVEKSNDEMKKVFYQGTEQGGFDELLNKLQTVLKSVRGMKEVEEFRDVREEWKHSYYHG